MKKLLVLLLAMVVATSFAFAASNKFEPSGTTPTPYDEGGPDEYGYSWEDNDGGGTVPYEWFEISEIGTEVEGLADDNNVGPIPIGFDFPYYWYHVNRLWIGSNGYTSFSSNANYAHPFSNIPYPGQPNDLLAVLTGDLDFTRGDPHCYYWTNNTDSFVVQWEDVGEFGYIDSTHTFQMVLDATDSSITFYYGEQHGNFLDSNGENKNVIGIEEITGGIGLQYLRDNAPITNMFHDGLALRFHPEPDPDFELHDVGILTNLNDQNGAMITPVGWDVDVKVQVANFGTEDESGFNVVCIIKDAGNTTVFTDTITVEDVVPASSSRWVTFSGFTPDASGQYRVDSRTYLSGDEVPLNNSKRAEIRAAVIEENTPVDLMYDDGSAENGRAWNGDFSGYGNEFDLFAKPFDVNSVQVHINSVTFAGNLHVWVMDDDGTGNPGDILAADTLMITTNDTGFVDIDFTADNITIEEGKVFAIGIHETQSTLWFSMDESATTPFSHRGWEYTGGLAGDRDRETSDIMIRMNVTPAVVTGIEDEEEASNLPREAALAQNYPNPFNAATNINYYVPEKTNVNLEVFNLMGQKVSTLVDQTVEAGNHSVTWDTDEAGISSGIYFYRLTSGDQSIVKRMTLMK